MASGPWRCWKAVAAASDLQLRLTNQAGHPCLLVLLPLTSSDGLEGFRRRLRQLLAERHGQDSTLESLGVRSHEHELLPKTRARSCASSVQRVWPT